MWLTVLRLLILKLNLWQLNRIFILKFVSSSILLLVLRLWDFTNVVLFHFDVAEAIFQSVLHEERVSQSFIWSYPVTWVFDKHPENDVFNFFRILPESPVVHVRVLVFDQSECSLSVLTLERKLTANKGVEDDAC